VRRDITRWLNVSTLESHKTGYVSRVYHSLVVASEKYYHQIIYNIEIIIVYIAGNVAVILNIQVFYVLYIIKTASDISLIS
jgi:hypothetical protein